MGQCNGRESVVLRNVAPKSDINATTMTSGIRGKDTTSHTLNNGKTSQPFHRVNGITTSASVQQIKTTSGGIHQANGMTSGSVQQRKSSEPVRQFKGMTSGSVQNVNAMTSGSVKQRQSSGSMQQAYGMTSASLQQRNTSRSVQQANGMTSGSVQQANGLTSASVQQANGMTSGSVQQANGMTSGSVQQANGMTSGSVQQANGMTSGSVQQANGMTSGSVQQANGMTSGSEQQANLMTSGYVKQAGGMISAPEEEKKVEEDALPPFVELTDRFGNSLHFLNGGDVMLGPTPLIPDARQRLAEIREMELRDDDVIIAGFMKSGNHWVQQMTRMLVRGNSDYQPNTLTFEVFEYIPLHMITAPDQPRVFFTHLRFHHLPKQVLEKKIKIIHLLRNPKDTFVSLFCHLSKTKGVMGFRGTWDHFFSDMLEMGFYHGDWFDHVLDWEQEIASHPEVPVLVLPYEDLKRDPLGHVQKLNAFLGQSRSEELCARIVDTCQLSAMREKEEDLLRKLDIFTKDSPGIYRKGQVGDWKNWFTPAQSRMFDRVYNRRMAKSKRTFVFE